MRAPQALLLQELCCLGALALLAAGPALRPPPVTLHEGQSNTFLVAVPNVSSGAVVALGGFDSTQECLAACLRSLGRRCESFSYYHEGYVTVEMAGGAPNAPGLGEGAIQRQCFALTTAQWSPTARNGSTAGRLAWPCRPDVPSDCSLNGRCLSAGAAAPQCDCTPPWAGPRCDQLDVLPTPRGAGYLQRDEGRPTSSWKGTVLEGEDGRWHMWTSELTHHCGIDAWLGNSRVVHAVADSPTSTFVREDVVFDVFATEPHVIRGPDKEYVMYFSANFSSDVKPCVCTNGRGSTGEGDCPFWATTGSEYSNGGLRPS